MTSVQDRFLKYVSFDTQSDEFSETCPSTDKQKLLGVSLVEEMIKMGIADARIDENGYVRFDALGGISALDIQNAAVEF